MERIPLRLLRRDIAEGRVNAAKAALAHREKLEDAHRAALAHAEAQTWNALDAYALALAELEASVEVIDGEASAPVVQLRRTGS